MTERPLQACVLLLRNYEDDRQQSMLRFAGLLAARLAGSGVNVRTLAPAARVGRLAAKGRPSAGARKWLAYVDKYVLFPQVLRRGIRELAKVGGRPPVVHICDHSNAVYVEAAAGALGRGRNVRVLVTCHDLGAVRGALGEATYCPASATGKILQRWIARGLGRADRIACVSSATESDVRRLIRSPDGRTPPSRVILNGQNVDYKVLAPEETQRRLAGVRVAGFDPARPFLLNVGSSLPRKNRDGVLRIFARMKDRWQGCMVFAGEALPADLARMAGELGVADRVAQIVEPPDTVLEALYNGALALVFPSRFEGFGWPVIEAWACGCPVVCSGAGSLAEVAAGGAFVRGPDEEEAFAEHLLRMAGDPAERQAWVERGLANLARFTTERMVGEYMEMYRELDELA